MKTLLLSCSFLNQGQYLEYATTPIKEFLEASPAGRIIFIPYAVPEHDAKTERLRQFLTILNPEWGSAVIGIHQAEDPKALLRSGAIKAIFVTGGNTFLLLKALQDLDVLEDIKTAVIEGASYIGVSAGANLACPTIMTTNDMPIVMPRDFNGLGLVDFQVNPHFINDVTREERISEYIRENNKKVVGLPDGAWITVDGGQTRIDGADTTVFSASNAETRTWRVGEPLG